MRPIVRRLSTEHRHEFHGLWTHFGPLHRPDDRHYHPCMEEDCPAVLVGVGRQCGGPRTRHHVCKWLREVAS